MEERKLVNSFKYNPTGHPTKQEAYNNAITIGINEAEKRRLKLIDKTNLSQAD